MKIQVEVRRSLVCTVEVEVDETDKDLAAEMAIDEVEKESFVLPRREDWDGMKDWSFTVYDDMGLVLAEREA